MACFYIHIPFCRKACEYCNFHFSTSLKKRPELIGAIQLEIIDKKKYLPHTDFETIYFGGGTPSLVYVSEIESLLNEIFKNYSVSENPEITIEANPDDLSPSKLKAYKSLGINRLSIGIQSFNDQDLLYLGRTHTSETAENCIRVVQKAGFENITIDLIYGIPGSSDKSWKKNLEKTAAFGLPHFSAYALTVEPKTILNYKIKNGLVKAVDDDLIHDQFFQLVDFAGKNGYEHYEISNFARKGFRSRHNSSYWEGIPYVGTGPSAHSFNTVSRQWNTAINTDYIRKINSGVIYYEKEILTEKDRLNEFLMLSLRTSRGLNIEKLNKIACETEFRRIESLISQNVENGNMLKSENIVRLTPRGMIFSDAIISGMFT